MNRLAVVIAADSASTVSHWTEKGNEERYFKGANKIFQLSDHHPVGLMIFDSADMLRVPWEIVVKAFRNELGNKSFNTLSEYADDFFSFLEKSSLLFPQEIQKSVFLENARAAAIRVTIDRQAKDGETKEERFSENDQLVAIRRAQLDRLPLPKNITQANVDETIAAWAEDLLKLFIDWADTFGMNYPSEGDSFAQLGILEVFKNPGQQMGKTGLVFAGFGDRDIFPSFCEYQSCGIVAGRHVATEIKNIAITHDQPAWLDSFAQTDMCDTFSLGISRDVFISVIGTVQEGLKAFSQTIVGNASTTPPDLDEKIKAAIDVMGDSIMAEARREHAIPMRRVLGVLPVDEMADLAETLINLQSLKEKVTKRSETVGGPVDVAIITKNEGFLWVKRKHFFEMSLNSRFALRQKARLV